MNRDRVILWAFIIGLGLLIVVQIVGNGIMSRAQKQDDSHSKPSHKSLDLFAH